MLKPALLIFCAWLANAQTVNRMPRKIPGADKPVCVSRAICFSGEVSADAEFRKALNADLDFVIAGRIALVPKRPGPDCDEFASVVTGPQREHRDLYIDTSYGWTAEQEVSTSPREFRFGTNCNDYRIELERLNLVLWPYTATPEKYEEALAKLSTSPLGKGRLWITGSRISHAHDTPDEKAGTIEWMKFSVEIILPRR
jgi:hypothetical protein